MDQQNGISRDGWSAQFWANPRKAGIEFVSEEELDAAIGWLWEDPEMRDLPRVHVGRNTMIVPEAAVDRFREKGFSFVVRPVISAGDIAPEQRNRIRRGEE